MRREGRDGLAILFELSSAFEPAWSLGVVLGTRDPDDIVVGAKGYPLLAVFLADDLEAVIADEDGGGATLVGVCLHFSCDGEDGGAAEGVIMMSKKVNLKCGGRGTHTR